jgi:hypothetical protein
VVASVVGSDGSGKTHRINRIEPTWVEFDGAPPEPALRLTGGLFVALVNVEPRDIVFVTRAFPNDA